MSICTKMCINRKKEVEKNETMSKTKHKIKSKLCYGS